MELLFVMYTLYVLTKLFVAQKQISYVKIEKQKEAIFLKEDDYIKAGNYTIAKQILSQVETIIEYIVFIFWVKFGFSYLEQIIDIQSTELKAVIFILGFLTVGYFISLPFEIYQKFSLDKKYNFSNMTIKVFLLDTLKNSLLFYTIGGLIIYLISIFVTISQFWWLYAFAFLFILIILINVLYPLIRGLMYDKFKQLEDIELKTKIEDLLKSVNFSSSGVFSVDASKRDNRLNAYFGGLGKTKRVVLFDTLLEKLTHNELLAVLGHELGHFKNRDVYKNIFVTGVMLFTIFFVIAHIPLSLYQDIGFDKTSYSMISLFILIFPIFGFIVMPLISILSRHNEYAADKFGSNLGGVGNLKSALIKLVNENLHFPKSHYLFIFFYYSHPPIIERIKCLDALKARESK
jgi:STE24 endopeptidase